MYVAIYIPSGKKGSEIGQRFTFCRLLFVVQMYSKFVWPNDEIGQKMVAISSTAYLTCTYVHI